MKPLPGHILDKVRNVSSQESAELMSFLRPPNPDQGYGHQRYNDQDHRRQQYWDREPSRRQGGREGEPSRGSNNFYGPSGGNPGRGDRSNHPADLITTGLDFQNLINFGPRSDFNPPNGPNRDENGRERHECLNHVYLRNGCSLPNCPRRCNHTTIEAGSVRHRECLDYRRRILERAARAGARDFQ